MNHVREVTNKFHWEIYPDTVTEHKMFHSCPCWHVTMFQIKHSAIILIAVNLKDELDSAE